MSKSARRPQRIFSIVMWLLSIVFAGFLMGLGGLIIRDLPQVDQRVTLEQFIDQKAMTNLTRASARLRSHIQDKTREITAAQQIYKEANADYLSEKISFDNWLATRTATQSKAQNPEVLKRTRQVERLQSQARAEQKTVSELTAQRSSLEGSLKELSESRDRLRAAAGPEHVRARNGRQLRVFLLRLMITLPLLLIAAWMVAKKRGSAYWPLYRGFVLFALFAFFVELVPYLPSYGGYVRFGVGVLVVGAAGHFIIRGMKQYMLRKQEEEARSESERRQSIGYETALKKIAANSCPGCDRAILKKDGVDVDFCVHCGIRLQAECTKCDHKNISFHKFCLSCGAPSEAASAVEI